MTTQSEQWFEDYCAHAGIAYARIPEAHRRTPDYEVMLDGQPVIVEVKELCLNPEEQESDRVCKQRGYGAVLSTTPGDRVRSKITDASRQIKARTRGIYPGILVLCDLKYGCGQIAGHLDPYHIRVAMYGLEQIRIKVPRDPTLAPYATGMSYGPKRKMTPDHNTSISAIGVLFTPGPETIVLHVYHNRFAAVPLNPQRLVKHGIRQFTLEAETPLRTERWGEVVQ